MYSQCTLLTHYGRRILERTIKGEVWRTTTTTMRNRCPATASIRAPQHHFLSTLSSHTDDEDEDRSSLENLFQAEFLPMDDKSKDYEERVTPFPNKSTPSGILDQVFEGVEEEELIDSNPSQKSRTAREFLEDLDENQPTTLEETQLWFECLAQHESVKRYQAIIASARDRKDYASLNLVQKQIMEWYQPLKDEFEMVQKVVLLRTDHNEYPKTMAEGPTLLVLQPQKLAVIAAHESIVACLQNSECPVLDICLRLGAAVESECLVQLALYRKMAAERKRKTGIEQFSDDEDGEYGFPDEFSMDPTMSKKDAESLEIENPLFPVNEWAYGASHLRRFIQEGNYANMTNSKRNSVRVAHKKARRLLNSTDPWTTKEKVQLGGALLKVLLKVAHINNGGTREPAFTHGHVNKYKDGIQTIGVVALNDHFNKAALKDEYKSFSAFTTRYKPMVTPPTKWTATESGGYKWLKTPLMRTHDSKEQFAALKSCEMSTVYDGLNVLGDVPWSINQSILSTAKRCWTDNIAIGDIPTHDDVSLPPEPIPPASLPQKLLKDKESELYITRCQEFKAFVEARTKYQRAKQKNMDLNSLRCSVMLKFQQAEQFKSFEAIYFPYNLDFRGRAYPVPPHLSNIGSDLCRGLLTFAKKKPLGERGLYWLKVHLSNLGGNDKSSFDDRAKHTENNMDSIRAAVDDPFGNDRWWMSLEDPFQGLATCHEIVHAIDSGDPASFMSGLPVHMDGSCNGLQHYAALGRDVVGGAAVNLIANDKPQDVYSEVMREVVRHVTEEAARDVEFTDKPLSELSKEELAALKTNRSAKLVNGLVDRGVVKRTVMTSVYGVTFSGARTQIQEKLEEKLSAQGADLDEISSEVNDACTYLATLTMNVMGSLFVGAKDTMNWLSACAKKISEQGNPVAWISPIGVPVVQPYRQQSSHHLTTLVQTVVVNTVADDLPLHKRRQVTAFPPNYVHSLDSSHMLLTALEMDRRGLTFSAVHDSFWTHACDVDEMNVALRDCFIELYEQPILETLKQTWEIRYPNITFPDVPPRGKLDLKAVKDAKYFFQ